MAASKGDLEFADSVDVRTLTVDDDFDEVQEAVQDVIPRWRFVGGALGVRQSQIQTIQATYRPVDECMNEVILVWLRRAHNEKKHGPPTWKKLVQAIASRAGGQDMALARTIAKEHPAETTTAPDTTSSQPSASTTASVTVVTISPFPETTSQTQQAPHIIRCTTESDGEAVSNEAYGIELKRFQAHESAKLCTSIEFSFGMVQIKEGRRQTEFESYTMKCGPHGICVIINNTRFSAHTERVGTHIDEVNLTQCFRYLGYTVEIHRNCTAHQIESIFSYYRKSGHAGFDSFVVCILSHGDDGHVFGTDSKSVELQAIIGELNAESCTSLAGKPKMFFIQACRGGDRTQGTQIASDSGAQGPSMLRSSEAVRVISDSSAVTIPEDADFFFGNATPPGKVAWRDMDHGSWYVSEICRTFCSLARFADLVTMITKVHNEVGTRYENLNYRQAPEANTRLRKQVYFFN